MLKKTLAALAIGSALLSANVMAADYTVDKEGQHAFVDFNLGVFGLGGVKAELAIQVLEGTGDVAVAQVADFEIDEGVLAFLVDHVVSGHRRTCGQQGRTDCQRSECFFQHAFYSL